MFMALTFVLICSFSCVLTLSLVQKSPPYYPVQGPASQLLQGGSAWAHTQDHTKWGGAEGKVGKDQDGRPLAGVSPCPPAPLAPESWPASGKDLPSGLEARAEQARNCPCFNMSCLKVKRMWDCLCALAWHWAWYRADTPSICWGEK